ncbi:MAG: hypothetical protein RRC07_07450 [Anaerolineae bacterium]|nr:hypothetical protein [Anaerolineae bacterium]
MQRVTFVATAFALLLLLLLAGPSSASPAPRFGIVEAFWSPQQAAALGADWERILFYWSELQPTGPEDWNTLHVMEEWLGYGEEANREIIGLIKHTPAWATDGDDYSGVPRGLYLPLDDPDNLWATFVRRLVDYYSVRGIHRWIIWNEPDIDVGVYGNEFEGTIEDYARLLKVAYLVMQERDPQVTVHLAGLTYWHDVAAGREQYLDRLLDVLAADPEARAYDYYFDVLSLHIYFRTETVPEVVAAMDAIQRRHGLDKPIWINETNAAPTLDPLWPVERPQFQVDLEQQAWFIVQAHALAFAAGVESIGVYKFSDVLVEPGGESFGLLRADFSERPAFQAHRTTIQQLRGFASALDESSRDYHLVTFTHPDRVTRILWTQHPAALALRLPVLGANPRLVEVEGTEQPLTASGGYYDLTLGGARCYDTCIIGGPPVFIVEEAPALPAAAAPAVQSRATVTPLPGIAPAPAAPSPFTWLILGLLLLAFAASTALALRFVRARRAKP